jgi:uncharacterized membrane protein
MYGLVWLLSIVGAVVLADKKNLSVPGCFFMALFLGPVGLIIALLLPPRTRTKPAPYSPSGNIRQEIADLKTALTALNERIAYLERACANEPQAVREPEQAPPSVSVEPAAEPTAKPEAMEFVLGKYWLSRIGVGLFVLGIGLFISYTFHYFSPLVKIMIGYFFAVAFLVWGERLEKNAAFRRLSWAILGGSWGLFYLTTYATHYIPATRLIETPGLALILLWVVSVCCIRYNLKYRSWIATGMSFFFGFMTMGLGALDFSSVGFWALLLGSLAFVAYRFGWFELLVSGLVGSYGMYCVVLAPKLDRFAYHASDYLNFRIAFAILTVTWCVFAFTFILQKLKEKLPSRQLVSCTLANTSLYVWLGLWLITSQLPLVYRTPRQFAFLMVLALTHMAFAALCRMSRKTNFIVLHTALAITLGSFALLLKYPQLSMSFWWILETAVVFGLGIYYREQVYRMMGWVLGVFVLGRFLIVDLASRKIYNWGGVAIEHGLIVGAMAAVCFALLGVFVQRPAVRDVLRDDEKDFYFFTFPIACALTMLFLMGDAAPARWLTLNWTVLGLGLLGIGFFLKHRAFRFCALGVLALACTRIVAYDLAGVDTIYKIVVVIFLGAVLLGVSLVYSRVKQNPS